MGDETLSGSLALRRYLTGQSRYPTFHFREPGLALAQLLVGVVDAVDARGILLLQLYQLVNTVDVVLALQRIDIVDSGFHMFKPRRIIKQVAVDSAEGCGNILKFDCGRRHTLGQAFNVRQVPLCAGKPLGDRSQAVDH